ncbi:MAG TPA: M91 family zinc metallopeptidase, partial [Noviherbaspirillum sp.]
MPTNYTAADFTVQNATAEDTAQLNHALEYLQQSPDAQEILKGMHDKGVKISIIHDGNDHYTDGNKTIYWDPKSALTVQPNAGGKSTGMQSPALGLIHEGAHATDPDLVKHASEANAQYENNAEKYAIDKENKIGATLGEP